MRNEYFHKQMEKLFDFLVPKQAAVLRVIADPLKLEETEKKDYIVLTNVIGYIQDVQKSLEKLHRLVGPRSRIIITYYNYLWEPCLKTAEFLLGARKTRKWRNWLSKKDVENLLYLAGFEIVKQGGHILIPFNIPLISRFFNKYLAHLPLIERLCLVYYAVARPLSRPDINEDYSVSIIIPARNEKGNIEQAIQRMPKFGSDQEIIFVEGHSSDKTLEEIKRCRDKYRDYNIKVFVQPGEGKADAVWTGFDKARGDILIILDADLTVKPEDLPKFYESIRSNKGEFINGCRLVYPLEKESMRFLNILGNKFFSYLFSWLLGQAVKDTLCGTKVFWRSDYEKIRQGRSFFGDFDPFGDFDLLLGASKLNLKIIDLPIRYQERTYGRTNISRFRHGWILLKMSLFAMRKIKFI